MRTVWKDGPGANLNGNSKLLEDLTGPDNSTQTGLDIEISGTDRKMALLLLLYLVVEIFKEILFQQAESEEFVLVLDI